MKGIYHSYESTSRQTLITLSIVLVIAPILMILIWITTLPQILTKFTIITNIEMMKDRELIEKVINEQKLERSKRSYRIY